VTRYFFNVYDDVVAFDEEGIEMPNLAAARLKALQGARELIGEQVRRGYVVLSHWIDVIDESGAVAYHLPFKDAFEIKS
jgi:hypothetical protein